MILTKTERMIIESKYWEKKRRIEIKFLTDGIKCDDCKILNIGCGRNNLKLFEAKKVVNIDVERLSNVDLVTSALNLPFGNNEFDIIFFLRSLHHINDYYKALEEALRCVRPNGFILISEPYNIAVKAMKISGLDSHPEKIIKRRCIEEYIKKHNLTITKKKSRLFLFYYAYQIQA